VALGQPASGVDGRVGARFDPPVALLQGFVTAHGSIGKAALFLFSEEQLDIVAQIALIAFEGQHVVGLSVDDSWRRSPSGSPHTPKACCARGHQW
jgi:hypothetical protein